MRNNIIKKTESDNVGIIPYMTGLPKDTEINDGIRLIEDIVPCINSSFAIRETERNKKSKIKWIIIGRIPYV